MPVKWYIYPAILNLKKKDIHIIVDKNPFYAKFISELIQVFPDAKFIHLIRDPKSVVSSHRIAFNKGIIKSVNTWMMLNKHIEATKTKAEFLTIKYEDLVKAPSFLFN